MEFEAYSVGLVHASVCTNLSVKDATARLNDEHPTGIKSWWKPSEDGNFASGESNPCNCPDHKGNKHYLFVC